LKLTSRYFAMAAPQSILRGSDIIACSGTSIKASGVPRLNLSTRPRSWSRLPSFFRNIPGDWKILDQSAKHEKVNSATASWTVAIPAEGSAKLTYRVHVKY
jgi:hypothetical protein